MTANSGFTDEALPCAGRLVSPPTGRLKGSYSPVVLLARPGVRCAFLASFNALSRLVGSRLARSSPSAGDGPGGDSLTPESASAATVWLDGVGVTVGSASFAGLRASGSARAPEGPTASGLPSSEDTGRPATEFCSSALSAGAIGCGELEAGCSRDTPDSEAASPNWAGTEPAEGSTVPSAWGESGRNACVPPTKALLGCRGAFACLSGRISGAEGEKLPV